VPLSWPCSTSSVRDDKIYVTTSCVCQSLSERLCHLLLLLRYCCMRSAVALALSRTGVGPWSVGPEVMWVFYNGGENGLAARGFVCDGCASSPSRPIPDNDNNARQQASCSAAEACGEMVELGQYGVAARQRGAARQKVIDLRGVVAHLLLRRLQGSALPCTAVSGVLPVLLPAVVIRGEALALAAGLAAVIGRCRALRGASLVVAGRVRLVVGRLIEVGQDAGAAWQLSDARLQELDLRDRIAHPLLRRLQGCALPCTAVGGVLQVLRPAVVIRRDALALAAVLAAVLGRRRALRGASIVAAGRARPAGRLARDPRDARHGRGAGCGRRGGAMAGRTLTRRYAEVTHPRIDRASRKVRGIVHGIILHVAGACISRCCDRLAHAALLPGEDVAALGVRGWQPGREQLIQQSAGGIRRPTEHWYHTAGLGEEIAVGQRAR